MGVCVTSSGNYVYCNRGGCQNKTEVYRDEPNGQNKAKQYAERLGWLVNYRTGDTTCPSCLEKQEREARQV